eukprot:jgi/Chrzof1/5631/Cz16g09180.t1
MCMALVLAPHASHRSALAATTNITATTTAPVTAPTVGGGNLFPILAGAGLSNIFASTPVTPDTTVGAYFKTIQERFTQSLATTRKQIDDYLTQGAAALSQVATASNATATPLRAALTSLPKDLANLSGSVQQVVQPVAASLADIQPAQAISSMCGVYKVYSTFVQSQSQKILPSLPVATTSPQYLDSVVKYVCTQANTGQLASVTFADIMSALPNATATITADGTQGTSSSSNSTRSSSSSGRLFGGQMSSSPFPVWSYFTSLLGGTGSTSGTPANMPTGSKTQVTLPFVNSFSGGRRLSL